MSDDLLPRLRSEWFSVPHQTMREAADEIERLRAALQWALPLAEIAQEDYRQQRLKYGHDDIGAGTDHIGLWPEEVAKRDAARAALEDSSR